ncbi:pyridoxamine 5'-phosphate oxidase family protein [bacterium]|nr:pyridoxamine 5'-phosphate oxidase family protein [bacterium]
MEHDYRQAARDFIRNHPVCHLATVADGQPWCRAMHTNRLDDDFTVWFASFASSNKLGQLRVNPRVCLSYFESGCDVRLFGRAEILDDQPAKDAIWRPELARLFPRGAADPELIVLKITPQRVLYRDFTTTEFNAVELLGDDSAKSPG